MKRTLLIVCLIVSAALLAQATPQKGNGLEQAVLKLEQEWVDALIKADAPKLETLYADTLVYTHSSGSVDDKAKYLANLKAGGTKYISIDRDDIKVNTYGDTAIVTCHALIKLKANGADRTVDARMIHVYSKIKGRWQMVAHQTTKLG
jgi:ketosteroid isomerase-like protein